MLVSEIKRKFRTYFDVWSANWSTQELTDIFSKASDAYWTQLADRWGKDLQNDVELQAVTKTVTFAPLSNVIPLTEFPDYNRIGYLIPTYVVNGKTYNSPAKEVDVINLNSVFTNGTLIYPRYYFLDDSIVLTPTLAIPTSVTSIFLTNPPVIDFGIADYDVNITDRNVYGICEMALKEVGIEQREYDFTGASQQNNAINK